MNRLSILPLLALAACQTEPSTTNAGAEQRQAEAPVKDVDVIPADETAAAAEGKGDGAPPPEQAAIPVALHGRWGLTPADCNPARGDDKGRLVITDDTLGFYESEARLERVTSTDPGRFVGRFAFSGEGQRWTRTVTLALEGDRLLRSDEEVTTPLRYAPCPRRRL